MFAMVMNQQMAVFASFASESKLQVYGAVTLFFSILFGGYIIPLDTIPTYFYWAYWINPFAWAYNAMIVNEVYSGRYENPERLLIENGLVGPDGSPFSKDWIGWSLIFMGVFFLFCWILTALGLAYTRNSGEMVAPEKAELPMEKDVDGEQDASTTTRIDIPFKPVTLSVKDLCYEVTASTSNNKLMLLKNVNGIFHPGRLCALMGSTGAGCVTRTVTSIGLLFR